MAPRLKVFVTSDGLTDYVVAATSKAKALAAWGSHQDLFKTGLARQTDDPQLVKAASARPGEVLRRPAGTRAELARLKILNKRPAAKEPVRPAGPSKAALKKVADLENRLAELDRASSDEITGLEGQRAALDARIDRMREAHQAERRKLQTALEKARGAL